MVKRIIVGAERDRSPWHDSLTDEEIQAVLESEKLTWDSTRETLTINISSAEIFSPEIGEAVYSITLDKADARSFLKARGLTDEEIIFYMNNDAHAEKTMGVEEIKDDFYWGVGVNASITFKNEGQKVAFAKMVTDKKLELEKAGKSKEQVKKALDDYAKKLLTTYLKGTGLDTQLLKSANVGDRLVYWKSQVGAVFTDTRTAKKVQIISASEKGVVVEELKG